MVRCYGSRWGTSPARSGSKRYCRSTWRTPMRCTARPPRTPSGRCRPVVGIRACRASMGRTVLRERTRARLEDDQGTRRGGGSFPRDKLERGARCLGLHRNTGTRSKRRPTPTKSTDCVRFPLHLGRRCSRTPNPARSSRPHRDTSRRTHSPLCCRSRTDPRWRCRLRAVLWPARRRAGRRMCQDRLRTIFTA